MDASAAAAGDALATVLRRLKPFQVKVTLSDGTTRDVAVPKRTRRWEAVIQTLEGLEWSRLELLDDKGALLRSFDAETPPAPADLELDGSRGDERLLGLMLKAQEVALVRHERVLETVMAGYSQLVGTLSERVVALETSFGQVLKLARDATVAMAEAQAQATATPPGGMSPETAGLMEKMVPVFMQKLSGGGAKPNGHSGG